MTDLTPLQLTSVLVHFGAAVAWGSTAAREWETFRALHPRNPLFRLLCWLTTLGTAYYAAEGVLHLLPRELSQPSPPPWIAALWVIKEWAMVMLGPVAWHLTRYWGAPIAPPSRRSVALAYGSGVAVATLTASFPWTLAAAPDPLAAYFLVRTVFQVVVFGTAVRGMAARARGGLWLPRTGGNVIRRADVWLFGASIVILTIFAVGLLLDGRATRTSRLGFLLDLAITVLVTTPVAARELDAVVRGLVVSAGMLAAAAGAYFAVGPLARSLAAAGAPRVADVATLLAVVAAVFFAYAGLRRFLDRVLLHRHAAPWTALKAFLAGVTPEAGAATCCRAALGELVGVLGLRGAAIILRDGQTFVAGEFAAEPLASAWPRGDALDALPPSLVSADYVFELPPAVVAALVESDVIDVIAITSPRCRWGALFLTSGMLDPAPQASAAVEAFTSQLALILDGAALLERTVAVERSLAHAEKLAAIGELAARIAHEIRNPVTAARSLAQLLAGDPTAPENREHAQLILEELERVERQVRALLQFARREEYRLEPVVLGSFVEHLLAPLRPRLDAARVELRTDLAHGVTAHVDREKLRQAVVNLVENALDALAASDGERRLAVEVASTNGTATLRVRDSGPGVADDALPHLFEPFFSLKASGTGLGLAIARRTVEAHGGRITAERATPHGMCFRIDLPSAGVVGHLAGA